MKKKVMICTVIAAVTMQLTGTFTSHSSRAAEEIVKNAAPAVSAQYVCSSDSGLLSGKTYSIMSVFSGRLLTAEGNGNIDQRGNLNNASQNWRIVDLKNGYCKILSENQPDMAVTAENGTGNDGDNICIKPDTGSDAQQFKLNKVGKQFYITTKISDNSRSLDVYNISREDRANICQWEYWEGDGQKFMILPTEQEYTLLRGDLNFDDQLDVYDLCLLRCGISGGFDRICMEAADINNDGKTGRENTAITVLSMAEENRL